MRLFLLIFSLSCHHFIQVVLSDEITLTRHSNGDVFTIPGSCNEACMVLSSDTASPFGLSPSSYIRNINDSCSCQCNFGLPVFREDLRICVDNIQECDVASFVSSSGLVEKIPYVFLPQYGQIIYPHAEIKFEGVETPICLITGVQQLGKSGWSELRNISNVEFPLSFYQNERHTFLQWIGDEKLRETTEGKIVVVKLACRDSYPTAAYRGVFTPCIAFRVSGTPLRSNIKEVSFSTSLQNSQGLTSTEYTAIGVSSMLLALIYVASVSLYLQSRKGRQKTAKEREPEIGRLNCSSDIEGPRIIKCNPLLSISRQFENDTNNVNIKADFVDKSIQNENEFEVEKITSAIIHPHEDYIEYQEQNCNSGPIIGEKLPEEDVRVIETTDNGNQTNIPLFPGLQRRKLYFNPAYFERQLLLAPPPGAIEFLLKIREVISIAKHKVAAKRFIPTLHKIPEELSSERMSSRTVETIRKRSISVQSTRKVSQCTGCPGCSHGSSTPNLPTTRTMSGESRVRAWLEDVKLLDARWRNIEEERKHQCQHSIYSRFKDSKDMDTESTKLSIKSLPPIFKEWAQRNICQCEEDSVDINMKQTIENSFKTHFENHQRSEQNEKSIMNKNESSLKKCKSLQNLYQTKNKKTNKKSNDIEKTRVLLNIINDELSGKNNKEAKRFMDAVIQELVISKEKEKRKENEEATKSSDYETDSLEKTRISKKLLSSPNYTKNLCMDEELKIKNTTIDPQINLPKSIKKNTIIKNHNLPEVIPLHPENYALVSEVYVNDGYTSPTDSDNDSGPDIQYELENPGHVTIKVLDSPKNYIKQDDSEYEPDTLDRKPMKLKINGEIIYDKNIVKEVYVDSLERTSQILLRSEKDSLIKPSHEYNNLREIYEAKIKYQQQQQLQREETYAIRENENNRSKNRYKACTCVSPLLPRQERRIRKADNQPDVVPKLSPPLLPVLETTYEIAKNAQDRSPTGACDPTTCEDASVAKKTAPVVGKPPIIRKKTNIGDLNEKAIVNVSNKPKFLNDKRGDNKETNQHQQYHRFFIWRNESNSGKENIDLSHSLNRRSSTSSKHWYRSCSISQRNLEDAYISSSKSNDLRRQLLLTHESSNSCNYTESDESMSGNGANSESGAESIETDSVFFGNFRECVERERLTLTNPWIRKILSDGNYNSFK